MDEPVLVPLLSTGQPSTLGSYLDNCTAFGLKKAAAYFEDKIASNPNGRDEVIIADERQVMYLIAQLERMPYDPPGDR
jgi:hypothetical protein